MKNKKYLTVGIITTVILCIIYFIKDIFPFGNNSIIWSDMHEQITALYYHFYDAIRGSKSILIDFTSGGGINFVGIMAYYILSPFSLILLLFPRELVENAVSIVVMLKIILSSVTCLYFINKYFKKINNSYQIFLSLLYAFSSYTLSLYIITPWMDIVYLFPILLIGLKKLLDLEDTKTYIITLTLSLIFCFYISFMVLIFIILSSLIYLYLYKKENIKKRISCLGISTIVSILISSVILIPTFIQIGTSQRVGFDLNVILNSKFGPLSDKISFLFMSAPLIACILLLLFNYKKHKKFISLILPLLILVGLPIIVEPINKLWHFGSYVYFPYRYGFILIFLLIIGACYYLNEKDSFKEIKLGKLISILLLLLTILVMVIVYLKYNKIILESIESLTLTRNKKSLIILFLIFLSVLITTFITLLFNHKNDKYAIISIGILTISTILFNSYFYLGRYDPENKLELQYDQMLELSKLKNKIGNYYVKEINRGLISNYGMVTNLNTFSNFTSLTDKINFTTMQRLGYDSYWMDTQSIGGNLFIDYILAQKYIITKEKYNNEYYNYIDNKLGINVYEFNKDIPYGFIVQEIDTLNNINNSYEASNLIYKSITNDEKIFDIIELFKSNDDNQTYYEKDLLIEKNITIDKRKELYLEIFADFANSKKVNNYKTFDIYVNDKLFLEKFPNEERNGSISLGIYENEIVNIKVISRKNTEVKNITVGILDLDKFNNFIKNSKNSNLLEISDNKINVKTTGKKGEILFLPITYLDGYYGSHKIVKVYDNFLGIVLNEGENNIEISYVPKGIVLGMILTIIGFVIYFALNKYFVNIEMTWFNNICYYSYISLYIILILVFYIAMLLFFIKSFVL